MRRTPVVLVAAAAAALSLAGCGSSGSSGATSPSPTASLPSSPAPPPSSPAPSETEQPADLTLDITVDGKTVEPAPTTVKATPGQSVSLTLTSDRGGELHVHAADPELETEVEPGTRTYTFDLVQEPGVYEVELHDPDLLLVSIQVQ